MIVITAPYKPVADWQEVINVNDVIHPGVGDLSGVGSLQTDGTFLYALWKDSASNSDKTSTIKTYQIEPNGDLTEVQSQDYIEHGGFSPNFSNYQGMFYKSGRMFVNYRGGVATYTVSGAGLLAETKFTNARITNQMDIFSGSLAHGKFMVVSSGFGAQVAGQELSYWTIDDGVDHTDPNVAFTGAYSYANETWVRNDKVYNVGQPTGTIINEATLSAAGAWSNHITHALPGSLTNITLVGDRLYYSDGVNFGHFPILGDDSLGVRVDDGIDWTTITPNPEIYTVDMEKLQTVAGGYQYRWSSPSIEVFR